jgi:hypothetical protein
MDSNTISQFIYALQVPDSVTAQGLASHVLIHPALVVGKVLNKDRA